MLIKHQIIRYVNDILLIYDERKTNTEETLTEFSKQQPTIKFTIAKELQNSINFLDLSTHCREKVLNSQYTENPLKQIS
jgi:hypothetical protein